MKYLLQTILITFVSAFTPSNLPEYDYMLKLVERSSHEVLFHWKATNNTTKYFTGAIAVNMPNKWLGFAVSTDKEMPGSDAIIGLPAEENIYSLETNSFNPASYKLNARMQSGVVKLPSTSQLLVNTTITTSDAETILRFSRLVDYDSSSDDEDVLSIDTVGVNKFLYAVGSNQNLVSHFERGSFEIDLGFDPNSEIGGGSGVVIDDSEKKYSKEWKIHGSLMFLAWAVCAPCAILSSILRSYLPTTNKTGGGKPLWFKLHMALNMSVPAFTLAALAVSYSLIDKMGIDHIGVTHSKVGIWVIFFSLIQVVGGLARPHAATGNMPPKRSRVIWERCHKVLGIGLFITSVYAIYAGLEAYSDMYGTGSIATYYFIVAVPTILVIIGSRILVKNVTKPNNNSSSVDGNED